MSKAGKFVKKHPWEAAGAAAAIGLGGPALLGTGGLLGGGSAAGGLASVYGPSALTAGLAGDAFMPAALGATGEGSPGIASLLGSKFAPGAMSGTMKNVALGANAANKMGLLGGQPTPPPSSGMPMQTQVAPTTLPQIPSVAGGQAGMDPKLMELLRQLMQQKQGGMA